MRPLIVFVDDELRLIDSYVRELQFEYDVKSIHNVDDLLEIIENKLGIIQLLILDIMMPTRESKVMDNSKTQNGMKAGLLLYEIIRSKDFQIPIIIFSNVNINDQDETISKINQDEKARFLQKEDYLPFELSNFIKDFLALTTE